MRQQSIYFRLNRFDGMRWRLNGFNDGDRLRPLDRGCVTLCLLSYVFFFFGFRIYTLRDIFTNLCQLVGKIGIYDKEHTVLK